MPKIIATSGPLKGREMPLTEETLSFGRDDAMDCCLDDEFVSRHHCNIHLKDGSALLCDLESKNGTFVNDEAISSHRLQEGDRLKVGSSTFTYMETEDGSVPVFDNSDHDRRRTLRTLRIDRSEPLYPNTDSIQACILDDICDRIPMAFRAAILLRGRAGDGFVSGMYRRRDKSGSVPFEASGKTCHAVLDGDFPVLSNDGDSVICVSIGVSGTKLGVLYADHPSPNALNEDDLKRLRQIAKTAAAALGHTRYVEWLKGKAQRLEQEIKSTHTLIGDSTRMRQVFDFINKVAPTDAKALILGESGTGKDLVARAIHGDSPRKGGPYVAVNCGAIAETLLESELFGCEKGAFTGAVAQRKGKLESAEGGTLFLDEVGELSLHAQAALLRFLQSHDFYRVGGTRLIKVNVRIIAATNRDLEQAVKEGRFREDLLSRLDVVSITLPRLADRPEDILTLANYFLEKHRRDRKLAGFNLEAQRILLSYHWPRNVRELENAIERACMFAASEHIRPDDLPEALTLCMAAEPGEAGTYRAQMREAQRAIIQRALQAMQGSFEKAAKLLRIDRAYLYRLHDALFGDK
jgi:transcriptional regulator with GAF, ATPase, and Fis domain